MGNLRTPTSSAANAVLLTACAVSLLLHLLFSEGVRAFLAETARLAGKI